MPSQTPEGDTQGITSHPYLTTSYRSQITSSRAEAEIPILKMSSEGFLFLSPCWSVTPRDRLCHLYSLKTSFPQIPSLDVWTFNPLNWSHHDGINTGEPPQKTSLAQFTSTTHWASSRDNSNYSRWDTQKHLLKWQPGSSYSGNSQPQIPSTTLCEIKVGSVSTNKRKTRHRNGWDIRETLKASSLPWPRIRAISSSCSGCCVNTHGSVSLELFLESHCNYRIQ